MKRAWTPLVLAFLVWAVSGCAGTYTAAADQEPPPPPPGDVDVSYFYDALSPYGNWIWDDTYGWIWYPLDVPIDWRPYTDGEWIWTDDGWTWDSDYPWGWATFHYGRWFDHPDYGWCWVPGTEWAPAWVAWREGDGWIGWAPLPPQIEWRDEGGFDWDDWDHLPGMRHHWWSFCRESDFFGPGIQRRLAARHRAVVLMRDTRNVTDYGFRGAHVVNRSIDVYRIRAAYGHDIPVYRIADSPRPFERPGQRIERDTFHVYRPRLGPAPAGTTPPVVTVRRQAPLQKPQQPGVQTPTPVPAPPVGRPGDQTQRQERDLQRRQAAERKQLQQEQQREISKPPQGVSQEQLRQQHEEEQRALEEQAARDQRALQARRQQEQQRQQVEQQKAPRQPQTPPGQQRRAPAQKPAQKNAPAQERHGDQEKQGNR